MIKGSLNLGFGKNLFTEDISKIVNGGAKVISENIKNGTIVSAIKIGPYDRELGEMELDEYAIFPGSFLRCLWMKHPKAVATLLVASILLFDAAAFAKDKPLVQQISKSSEAKSSQKSKDQPSQSKCKIIEPIRADNTPDSKKYDFVEQVLYIADIAGPTGFDTAKYLSNILYVHYFDVKHKKENGVPFAFVIVVPDAIWAGIVLKVKNFDNKPQKPNYNYIKRLVTFADGKCGPEKEEDGKIDEVYVINSNIIFATTTTGKGYRVKWIEKEPFENSEIKCFNGKTIKKPNDVVCISGDNQDPTILLGPKDELE
jgi:hypothetical protein